MRFYIKWLCAVFLTLSMGGATTPPGTVRGVVRDATGAVLPGAAVLIQHWRWGGLNSKTVAINEPLIYANSSGAFNVRLPPDLYDVIVSFPSLSPFAKKIKLKSNEETILDCELSFSPLVESVE